MVALFFKSRSI